MGFLDDYGAGDARYEKILKVVAIALVASLVGGFFYYVFFRNWREERQVRKFLALLEEGNLPKAYELWGCTFDEPCRYYPYDEFLEDWGPAGPLGKITDYDLGHSFEQKSGVIVTLEINGKPHPNLWVEKETKVVGFSPY